jgi:hypothetical protein
MSTDFDVNFEKWIPSAARPLKASPLQEHKQKKEKEKENYFEEDMNWY